MVRQMSTINIRKIQIAFDRARLKQLDSIPKDENVAGKLFCSLYIGIDGVSGCLASKERDGLLDVYDLEYSDAVGCKSALSIMVSLKLKAKNIMNKSYGVDRIYDLGNMYVNQIPPTIYKDLRRNIADLDLDVLTLKTLELANKDDFLGLKMMINDRFMGLHASIESLAKQQIARVDSEGQGITPQVSALSLAAKAWRGGIQNTIVDMRI